MMRMLSVGSFIYVVFRPLGVGGLLLALFVIFYFDATLFPTLPELFTVIIFLAHPVPIFGVAMVLTLSAAEFSGVTTLYLLVRKFKLPDWIGRRIKGYTRFLIIPNEKIILLNRVAPVIPFLGAFIATCNWPYGRSVAFNFIGGGTKYSLIILMASSLLSFFTNSSEAETVTIAAIILLIGVSYTLSTVRRSKMTRLPGG